VTLAFEVPYNNRIASAGTTVLSPSLKNASSEISVFNIPRTDWQREAERRLVQLIRLRPGWDGHQGKPANLTIAEYAYILLEALLSRHNIPLPTISPLSYGGLMLEWHRKGWDIEIEIDAPGSLQVYTRELSSGVEDEVRLGRRLDRLRDIVGKVAD